MIIRDFRLEYVSKKTQIGSRTCGNYLSKHFFGKFQWIKKISNFQVIKDNASSLEKYSKLFFIFERTTKFSQFLCT